MHDVFISFSFTDQQTADKIVNHLSNFYGISCWICTEEIRAGENFRKDIAEAIKNSNLVVFVQSKLSASSEEVSKELLFALKKGKMVKPFVIEESQLADEIELELSTTHYIDAIPPANLDERIRDLAKDICKTLGKPFAIKSDSADTLTVPDTDKFRITSRLPTCSKLFYGRDDILSAIHDNFESGNRIVVLQGMGGIGKSEIAKQYAARNPDTYKTVVFAQYTDSLVNLIADDSVFSVSGLKRKLDDKNQEQSNIDYARDKIKVFRSSCGSDTLIIIDNYDVPNDDFMEELVESGSFRLLVTSRCKHNDPRYAVIPIEEIPDDEALKDLVIHHCGDEYVSIDRDDPAFGELFDLTKRHTLALELVALYMAETSTDLSDMVELLRSQGLHTLGDTEIIRRNASENAYEIIRKLFSLTSLSDQEKTFLRCLCMMPDHGVEEKYFKKWCDRDVYKCRSGLLRRSIVKSDSASGKIFMHPLIREIAVNELEPSYENCTDFINRCAMVGDGDIPNMWGIPYTEKAILIDCYKSFLNLIPDITEKTYKLYVNISYMYNFIGEYSQAIALHERIYTFACENFGEYSAETILILNRIAWKNSNCRFFEKAVKLYETVADWFIKNPYYTTRESFVAIQNCSNTCLHFFYTTGDPAYKERLCHNKWLIFDEK